MLLVGLGALVLVGVFATELANESWDLVQAEVKADQAERERLEAEGVADALIVEADERWNGMLGPLNTSSVTGAVVSLVPNTARLLGRRVRIPFARDRQASFPAVVSTIVRHSSHTDTR